MLAFNLLAGTFPHEFFFNMRKYEALTMIVISARPQANLFPTCLKSSRGRRDARPAALVIRAYSQVLLRSHSEGFILGVTKI